MQEIFKNAMIGGQLSNIENHPFFLYNLRDKLLMVDDDIQIEALKKTGVQCFSQTAGLDFVEATFVHESGHLLDDKIFRKLFNARFQCLERMSSSGYRLNLFFYNFFCTLCGSNSFICSIRNLIYYI